MSTNLRDNYQREIHEEVVQENGPVPVDRHEHVEVVHDPNLEYREQVVEDLAATRRGDMAKVTAFIWLLTGILEALIGLRVVLKLIAANPGAPFASLVYSVTDPFLWPFYGLTGTPSAGGMVLEIPSLIAMIVYAAIAWVVVKVIWLVFSPTQSRSVSVQRHERV